MPIRRAKLVCTLGPACDSLDGLKALIDAGMDVARFNFSHGTHAEHGARLARLREASAAKNKPIAVLQDLCGPKIRVGTFDSPFELKAGAVITLIEGEGKGDAETIPINYEHLGEDVSVGDRIMFDDGRIVLKVVSTDKEKQTVRAEITQGGRMRNRVGVFLPTKQMRISPLTEKDKEDLGFGLSQGVDYVANAVFAGADAVMLSGETANGEYPLLAAGMMSAIALEAEKSPFFESLPYATRATSVAEAIARGAVNTAREIGAKFLVAFTESGSSAQNVSLARPSVPIVAFSPNAQTRRRMALLWGVLPRELPQLTDTDALVDWVTGDLMANGLASPGERVVIVFGAPLGVSGSTNSIRVHVIG